MSLSFDDLSSLSPKDISNLYLRGFVTQDVLDRFLTEKIILTPNHNGELVLNTLVFWDSTEKGLCGREVYKKELDRYVKVHDSFCRGNWPCC